MADGVYIYMVMSLSLFCVTGIYQLPEREDGRRATPCTVMYIAYTFHPATKVKSNKPSALALTQSSYTAVVRSHLKHRYLAASDDDIEELHQRERGRNTSLTD